MNPFHFFIPAVLIFIALINLICAQVPSEKRAVQAVETIGITDASVIKRQLAWGLLGGCGPQDVTKFTLRGTTIDGRARTIQVCAPLIGGYTVRG